jgi:hypothetical protein
MYSHRMVGHIYPAATGADPEYHVSNPLSFRRDANAFCVYLSDKVGDSALENKWYHHVSFT